MVKRDDWIGPHGKMKAPGWYSMITNYIVGYGSEIKPHTVYVDESLEIPWDSWSGDTAEVYPEPWDSQEFAYKFAKDSYRKRI